MDSRSSVSASLSKARAVSKDSLPALAGNSASARRAHAERIFSEFDKDKSGAIDRIEFKKILQASEIGKNIGKSDQKLLRKETKRMFADADYDSTRRLDFEEFFAFYQKNFTELVGNETASEAKTEAASAAVAAAPTKDAKLNEDYCKISGMVMNGEIKALLTYFTAHPDEEFSRSCFGGVPPIVLAAHNSQWKLVRFLIDTSSGVLNDGQIADEDRDVLRKELDDEDYETLTCHLDSIYTAAMERCEMMIAFTAGDIDLDKAQDAIKKQRHLRRHIRTSAGPRKELPKIADRRGSGRRSSKAIESKFVASTDKVLRVSNVDLDGVKKKHKALLLAAARGDLIKVEKILSAAFKAAKGKNFSAVVDCLDNMNTTPLMHASSFGLVELVNLLLKYNADASRQDTMLRTALSMAAERDHVKVLEALCNNERGVTCLWKTNKMQKLPFALAKRQYTKERLHFYMNKHPEKGVVRQNSRRHMDLLREKHQSVAHKQNQLTLAAIMNDPDYILAAMERDAGKDILHSVDQYGLTPLMHAAAYKNLAVAKCLLKHTKVKLNPKQQSNLGNTALHFAVESGDKDLVSFLTKKGFSAASSIKNKEGKVPRQCTAPR